MNRIQQLSNHDLDVIAQKMNIKKVIVIGLNDKPAGDASLFGEFGIGSAGLEPNHILPTLSFVVEMLGKGGKGTTKVVDNGKVISPEALRDIATGMRPTPDGVPLQMAKHSPSLINKINNFLKKDKNSAIRRTSGEGIMEKMKKEAIANMSVEDKKAMSERIVGDLERMLDVKPEDSIFSNSHNQYKGGGGDSIKIEPLNSMVEPKSLQEVIEGIERLDNKQVDELRKRLNPKDIPTDLDKRKEVKSIGAICPACGKNCFEEKDCRKHIIEEAKGEEGTSLVSMRKHIELVKKYKI